MRFYVVVALTILLSFVSVLSADQSAGLASESLNDIVILPAMLYMYRKLLTTEQQLLLNEKLMIAQQKRIIKLLRWRRTVLSSPCIHLSDAAEIAQ